MRSPFVMPAALLGLALALPSYARTSGPELAQVGPPTGVEPPGAEAPPPPPAPAANPADQTAATPNANWPWAHEPGTGMSGPASPHAANIDPSDTRSPIAPHFTSPDLGPDAAPDGYLQAALQALEQNRTGEAQQSLEMAETRMLDRSTPVGTGDRPDQNPRVQAVSRALQALGRNDVGGAEAAIREAMHPSPAGYAGAPPAYGAAPASPYGQSYAPPAGYAAPPSGYAAQPPGYAPPPAGYAPPAGTNYPPPGYGAPPPDGQQP